MNAFKWANLRTRMVFYPDDGGTAGSAPSGGSGNDSGGGGSSVAAPAEGGPASDGGGGAVGGAASTTPDPKAPMDWSSLGSADDLDHVEIPAEPPPVEKPEVVPPAAPQAPAVQEPPKATHVAEAQSPGTTADRPLSAADPWRIAEGLEANREAVIAHLAQSKFALSENDIKELDSDVTVAVPKLLSRVFLESQMAMQKFLAQAVPGMVKQYNQVTGANSDAEKKFFDTHKALDSKNPQHRETAVRIATLYRQANPGIPLEQLIQEVGPMVMASLRINAPAATAAQPMQAGRRPAAQGFRPAVNGGGGAPIAAEPSNEWAGLGQTYD